MEQLIIKLIPLYIFMFIGYGAARTLQLDKKSISGLVIYFITPVIVFYGTASMKFSADVVILPLLAYLCFTLSGLFAKYICRYFGLKKYESVIGLLGGNGNTGYYGIPFIIAIMGNEYFPHAVLVGLGALLFENTFGMYFLARSGFTSKQAIRKVLSMPTIYGFLIGLLVSILGVHFSEGIQSVFDMYKNAYIVVGMMIIGIGLYREESGHIDIKLMIFNLIQKFVTMPIIFALIIFSLSIIYPSLKQYQLLYFLISIVPMAAGTISLAIEFKQDVYQTAVNVIVSTLLSLPIAFGVLYYILHY